MGLVFNNEISMRIDRRRPKLRWPAPVPFQLLPDGEWPGGWLLGYCPSAGLNRLPGSPTRWLGAARRASSGRTSQMRTMTASEPIHM